MARRVKKVKVLVLMWLNTIDRGVVEGPDWTVLVFGDTYVIKEELKRLGFRWNGYEWYKGLYSDAAEVVDLVRCVTEIARRNGVAVEYSLCNAHDTRDLDEFKEIVYKYARKNPYLKT